MLVRQANKGMLGKRSGDERYKLEKLVSKTEGLVLAGFATADIYNNIQIDRKLKMKG